MLTISSYCYFRNPAVQFSTAVMGAEFEAASSITVLVRNRALEVQL
jgi:hypothetical protein